MKRALYGDRNHRSIAVGLHELGTLSLENGDVKRAKLYADQYFRMRCASDGDDSLSHFFRFCIN